MGICASRSGDGAAVVYSYVELGWQFSPIAHAYSASVVTAIDGSDLVLLSCVNRVSASTILIEVRVWNNFDKSLGNFADNSFGDVLRDIRCRIEDDMKWTELLVSNYLVSLGSVSVVRGSLGAQLVSCFSEKLVVLG